MTLRDKENEVIEEFELFDDWMDKYEYIIDLGKELVLIEEQYKTEENLIKGCQSRVWVWGEYSEGKINFTADSDAIITKGIIALLIRVLGNESPEEVVKADLRFIKEIGLQEHLSPTRANGLVGMVQQIKALALSNCG
ncbi:MAG: cysteine desulfuration protein SufE [Parvicella sp.]|jgi:cysteine desulfuration protein SufE